MTEKTPRELVNLIKRAGENAKIPGIFRVSSLYKPFQDLSEIPPDVLNAAADRGTKVHKMIADYIKRKGKTNLYFGEEVDGYYRSWLMWGMGDHLMEDKNTVVVPECPVGNGDLRGTADMLAVTVKEDCIKLTIWDWKTTRSPSPWHRFQVFVYAELAKQALSFLVPPKKGNLFITERNVLYLKPDGSGYDVSQWRHREDQSFERVLDGLVEVNRILWANNPKMRKEVINTHYNELHGGSEQ